MNRVQRIAERLVAQVDGGLDPLALSVAEFLQENPNPDDKAFHDWAEEEGLNVHLAEAGAYRLATLFSNFLLGGRANEEGFSAADADPAELAMGIEIEKEHSPDIQVRTRIALDHLAELPKSPLGYYTGLKWLEEFMDQIDDMSKGDAEEAISKLKEAMLVEDEEDDD
jgi:hypothetical protein